MTKPLSPARPPVLARIISLAVPVALLGGAVGSQYLGGLHPCEMCIWQRWPHGVAILLALVGIVARARWATALAALAILVSGGIGVFHAGVELGWWQGLTQCSGAFASGSSADILADIMATPLVRCDQVQWSFLGLSMAAWNAVISILAGLAILVLLGKGDRR